MGLFGIDLGKFVESVFTPPGTNARRGQEKKQSKVSDVAGGFLGDTKDLLSSGFGLMKEYQPFRADSIRQVLDSLSTSGGLRLNDELRTVLHDRANNTVAEQLNQLRSSGEGGLGLERGIRYGAMNEANRTANQALMDRYSPTGKIDIANSINELLSKGIVGPNLNILAQLASIIYGQPAINVGASPLESLLGGAAQYYGAKAGAK